MNNPKNVHIVFKVTNYLKSRPENSPPILPIDKVILIFLATHHGHLGIFPNQETLARECEISIRYVRERLQYLMECGLISITRIRRKHHYNLDFLTKELSTIAEPQFPYQETIAEPQFPSQRNHSSAHSGTTVPTNNSIKNPSNKIERGREERDPLLSLSFDFVISGKTIDQGMEGGLTQDEVEAEIEKYIEEKELTEERKTEKEWQALILRWVMNAVAYKARKGGQISSRQGFQGKGNAQQPRHDEPRSTVKAWGPGHYDYDRIHGIDQVDSAPQGIGNIISIMGAFNGSAGRKG